jgi:hypothetical protein
MRLPRVRTASSRSMAPMAALVLLWGSSLVEATPDDQSVTTPPDPVQSALSELVRACVGTDWPAESAARQKLVALGPKALPKLIESAQHHEEARVRRSCYQLLTDAYAQDERAIGMAVRRGLGDRYPAVRYHCAFLLGDLKVADAAQDLRVAFEGTAGKDNVLLRFTLAKSLAQLGQVDMLPILFAAVTDDSFMPRHVGNIGLKALSGRSLEDFEGYHLGEGASVIGGHEMMIPFDAVTIAERKLRRLQATTAYFRWLKAERPELYRHATYDVGNRRQELRSRAKSTEGRGVR